MNVAVGHFNESWREPIPLDPRSDFCELYARYWPRLVRLVQRRTGDRALAEDIAQTTLERLLDHIGEIDPRVPAWPWMKTVALNLVVDHFRGGEHEVLDEARCDQTNEEGLCYEDRVALRAALRGLSPRQRVALSLRYLEGWKSSEAAAFLGMSRPSFEQLLLRARNRIRCEYRRVTRDALAAFPLVRWLRIRRSEFSMRVPRLVSASESLAAVGPSTLSHLVAGTLALVLAGPASVVPSVGRPNDAMTVASASVGAVQSDELAGRGPTGSGDSGGAVTNAYANEEPGSNSGASPRGIVDDVTDPNKNVEDPEDARILSLAIVPDGPQGGRTIFAAGRTRCRVQPCPPVLFRSLDAGGSWDLLPALGLQGIDMVVPTGYGRVHHDVFAMGPGGLQRSADGGMSFELVTPPSGSFTTGSIAASPAYGAGDRFVLIGAQTLMRYESDTGALGPHPSTAVPGPFEPAFSPGYPRDPRIVLGGLSFSTEGVRSTVFVCRRTVCDSASLNSTEEVPRVRLGLGFERDGTIFAFTSQRIFSAGTHLDFSSLPSPERRFLVADVAVTRHGLIAAMTGTSGPAHPRAAGGLYIWDGASWTQVKSPLSKRGATSLATHGDLVVAALGEKGVACSSDGGRSWDRRC